MRRDPLACLAALQAELATVMAAAATAAARLRSARAELAALGAAAIRGGDDADRPGR